MPAELAEYVDRALGTDGFFQRRCEDVRKAERRGHASYFEHVLEAEKHAETIEEWCPTLIPGLLQTDAYARAVVRAAHPLAPDGEVEEKVTARMARASLFEDDHKDAGILGDPARVAAAPSDSATGAGELPAPGRAPHRTQRL